MNCRRKTFVGFIGAGNMGTAIMKGIAGSDELSSTIDISAFDPDPAKLESLKKYGVKPQKNGNDVVKTCKYIFLAVKPQVIEGVLEGIAKDVAEDTVLISIAAGISEDFIRSKTIPNAKVILVMPNTPFLLGKGSTAMANGGYVTDEEFEIVKNIFESGGIVEVIDKSKMKEVITINSSSPAYIYFFAKGFTEYAKSIGIGEKEALNLFSQALIGSAEMMIKSGYSIDELLNMVQTPGGTTEAGMKPLYEADFTGIIEKACKACTKRAYELSK